MQPRHRISRNKTSCCDLGVEPQNGWLKKTDVAARRGVGRKGMLQSGKSSQRGSSELPMQPDQHAAKLVCVIF